MWSYLENILKVEPVKHINGLAVRYGREDRVRDDTQIFWLIIWVNGGIFNEMRKTVEMGYGMENVEACFGFLSFELQTSLPQTFSGKRCILVVVSIQEAFNIVALDDIDQV